MSTTQMTPAKLLAVLAAGALFGFGLALSTMVQPEVVLSFLRFEDFGLMLVMGGAVLVTLLAYQLSPRVLGRPLLGGYFHQHVSHWNRDTLTGAALFGVGWGLAGVLTVCPASTKGGTIRRAGGSAATANAVFLLRNVPTEAPPRSAAPGESLSRAGRSAGSRNRWRPACPCWCPWGACGTGGCPASA